MDNLLASKLHGKKVIIWGARIVGIGFSRSCELAGLDVLCFIDSDAALSGNKVRRYPIYPPSHLLNICNEYTSDDIIVVLAVSIKESEIIHQVSSIVPSNYNLDILYYKDYSNIFYTIDIVSSCNLSCLSCAHSIDGIKPGGMMRYDDVEKVLNKIIEESPNCSHVSLYSWGEPLLHPQIAEIVALFHSRGIAVGISSNLSHQDTAKIDRVMRANPDYLKISLSGFYKSAYDSTHQGGDVSLVKSNMYRIAFLKEKLKLDTMIDINYHLYRNNCTTNYAKMQDLANELGFILSSVHALVMPLERVLAERNGEPDPQTIALQDNLLVNIDEGITASKSVQLDSGCPFMNNQMNINSDLSVPVCCLVFDEKYNVSANYLVDSFDSIQSAKHSSQICHECMAHNLPQYNMGFNKEKWFEIASAKQPLDIGGAASI